MVCSMLPKRRGHPLRSASKPCVRLVASHGSSILRSIVIDTLCFVFHVPLVMAMAVERELVAEFFSTTLTLRGDMINFYLILTSEEQSTPAAFPLLFL